MTEDDPDAPPIPIDQWPDPACHYAMAAETPVLQATNDAFEATFGPVSAGAPVAATLAECGLSPRDPAADVANACTAGGRLLVDWAESTGPAPGGDTFVLRTLPPEGDPGGVLVLTPLPTGGASDDVRRGLDLDHVASVISHDLRNPLDVATARLRAGRELDDNEHFEHVARAHDRMGRIVDDVLTLARGAEVVEPEEAVDLGAAAGAAWDTVETDTATLDLREPLPTTDADPDRVRRLFENLFRNAVEHGVSDERERSPPGEPGHDRPRDVTVTVGRLDDDDGSEDAAVADRAGFFVADDGPGIPASLRDRLFEPGYSSDDHGTGLGLAIVARIATLHGWSVDVATSATGGARIEVAGVDPA